MDVLFIIILILFIIALVALFLLPIDSSARIAGALGAAATLLTAYTIFIELKKSNTRAAQEDIEQNNANYTAIYSHFIGNPALNDLHRSMYSSENPQAHSLMTVMVQDIDNIVQYYESLGVPIPKYWDNVFRDWVNNPTFIDTWDDIEGYYSQHFKDYIAYLLRKGRANIQYHPQ